MSHRPDEYMAGTMGSADSIHWFATGRPRPGSVALCGFTATADSIATVRQGQGLGPGRFCPLCDHLARVEMDMDR